MIYMFWDLTNMKNVILEISLCECVCICAYVRLAVGFKAKCPLVGPGPIGRMPSVGVFLRDPSPYL